MHTNSETGAMPKSQAVPTENRAIKALVAVREVMPGGCAVEIAAQWPRQSTYNFHRRKGARPARPRSWNAVVGEMVPGVVYVFAARCRSALSMAAKREQVGIQIAEVDGKMYVRLRPRVAPERAEVQ